MSNVLSDLRAAGRWLIETGPFGFIIIGAAAVLWFNEKPVKRLAPVVLAAVVLLVTSVYFVGGFS